MLVYVRESTIHEVLEDVKSTDISDELRERLDEQRRIQQCRCTEAPRRPTLLTSTCCWSTTISELAGMFSKAFKVEPDKMRMWTQIRLPGSEELVDDLSGDGLAGDEPAEADRAVVGGEAGRGFS
ncbi:hypothetical protein quinque_008801 [Culex quinquefasciatus]